MKAVKIGVPLFFTALLVFVNCVYAQDQDARALFYQGNTHYNEAKFNEAADDYEKALSLGYESGQLYYNLAGAYFKSGLLGKAILNYKRAQRFIPRDADLISNLGYARSLIKNRSPEPDKNILDKLLAGFAGSFTLNEIILLSLILYLLVSVCVICFILLKAARKAVRYPMAFTAVLFAFLFTGFCFKFNETRVKKEAVVISETVNCKFEPFIGATTFFDLNEGESVIIVSRKEGWLKIQRSDGKQGWVESKAIEVL